MPNNWTLTEQAAIILKSYGVDDVEAAAAVVKLVLEEAAKVAFTAATSSAPATERKKIAAAIRALGDKS